MKPEQRNEIINQVLKHPDANHDKPVFFEIFKNGIFLYSWNGLDCSVIEFQFTLQDDYELRSAMSVIDLINMRFKALEIAHYDRYDNQVILFANMDL